MTTTIGHRAARRTVTVNATVARHRADITTRIAIAGTVIMIVADGDRPLLRCALSRLLFQLLAADVLPSHTHLPSLKKSCAFFPQIDTTRFPILYIYGRLCPDLCQFRILPTFVQIVSHKSCFCWTRMGLVPISNSLHFFSLMVALLTCKGLCCGWVEINTDTLRSFIFIFC